MSSVPQSPDIVRRLVYVSEGLPWSSLITAGVVDNGCFPFPRLCFRLLLHVNDPQSTVLLRWEDARVLSAGATGGIGFSVSPPRTPEPQLCTALHGA